VRRAWLALEPKRNFTKPPPRSPKAGTGSRRSRERGNRAAVPTYERSSARSRRARVTCGGREKATLYPTELGHPSERILLAPVRSGRSWTIIEVHRPGSREGSFEPEGGGRILRGSTTVRAFYKAFAGRRGICGRGRAARMENLKSAARDGTGWPGPAARGPLLERGGRFGTVTWAARPIRSCRIPPRKHGRRNGTRKKPEDQADRRGPGEAAVPAKPRW